MNSTKFIVIIIDGSFWWKEHISDLTSKLNKACYAIRAVKPLLSVHELRTIYFSYFHSIMSYGIIFWGNSPVSSKIFKIQKRAIRIMINKSRQESCQPLFNQLQILTLPSQYIFSLLIFVVKNKDLFLFNSEAHTINTRNNTNLHKPNTNQTIFQKAVLYSVSKLYNKLPPHNKGISDDLRCLKSALKNFLMERTLYSIEELYQVTWFGYDSCQYHVLYILYTVTDTILILIIIVWLIPYLQNICGRWNKLQLHTIYTPYQILTSQHTLLYIFLI